MNDFTKEELKLLGGCVFSKFVSSLDDPSIHHLQPDLKKLRDNIQSMIENYCEHEWRRSAINAIYCPYCQKHVEYSE
jgi:hypothetical protein